MTTSTLPISDDDSEPRFVLDLSRALRAWFDVTILAPAHPAAPRVQTLSDVAVVRYRYAPLRSLETLAYPGSIGSKLRRRPLLWGLVPTLLGGLALAIGRELAKGDVACVHSHWAVPQGFVKGAVFSGRGRPPGIVTVHGGDVYTARTRLARWMVGTALGRADRVTTVSTALRRTILDGYGDAIADEAIDVVPMGCDVGRFGPQHADPDCAALDGLPRPRILYVGRLSEKKGVSYLLRAMATPPLSETPATLAVAGHGSERAKLAAEAERLGLGARVRFLGGVDHGMLPTLYASCDIFCAPSIVASNGDREGVPTVLTEASASALPIVVTNVGGIAEIVADGRNGIVVPERDAPALSRALARLAADAGLRRRLGEEARASADERDWSRIAERHAETIETAIVGAADGERRLAPAAGR